MKTNHSTQPTAEPMFTQSFDVMHPPSDMPAWSVLVTFAAVVLAWAVVTFAVDTQVASTPPPPPTPVFSLGIS